MKYLSYVFPSGNLGSLLKIDSQLHKLGVKAERATWRKNSEGWNHRQFAYRIAEDQWDKLPLFKPEEDLEDYYWGAPYLPLSVKENNGFGLMDFSYHQNCTINPLPENLQWHEWWPPEVVDVEVKSAVEVES